MEAAKETTFKIDGALYKQFRIVCMFKGKKPREAMEALLKEWIAENEKDVSLKQFQKLNVG